MSHALWSSWSPWDLSCSLLALSQLEAFAMHVLTAFRLGFMFVVVLSISFSFESSSPLIRILSFKSLNIFISTSLFDSTCLVAALQSSKLFVTPRLTISFFWFQKKFVTWIESQLAYETAKLYTILDCIIHSHRKLNLFLIKITS